MATPDLDALQVFVAVAQQLSFTRAAIRLGRDKSQVSRTVRQLEESLRTTLLLRTTRAVRLTPEGEAFVQRVAPLVSALEAAWCEAPESGSRPAGEVTVTTTADLARAVLAPALATFGPLYPDVRVRVVLDDAVVDLMAEGVDLALRVGRPGGGTLIARRLGDMVLGFYAAPGWLDRRGTPRTIAHLAAHDGLWPASPAARASGRPPRIECADFGFLAELARAGAGVAVLPNFLAARDVALGALRRVLPEVEVGRAPVYLVSRPERPLPARTAAVRAHLLAHVTLPATGPP
jgi:DNA-binding transcriptional LysR family regulator